MALEFLVEFGNVYGPSVVKDCVQALKHTLLCKVHLVDQEPVTFLDSSKQGTIAPPELDVIAVGRALVVFSGRIFASKEVHHVSLLAQVDPGELPTTHSRQILDETGLTNSRRPFYQGRFLQLERPKQAVKIRLGCLGIKRK